MHIVNSETLEKVQREYFQKAQTTSRLFSLGENADYVRFERQLPLRDLGNSRGTAPAKFWEAHQSFGGAGMGRTSTVKALLLDSVLEAELQKTAVCPSCLQPKGLYCNWCSRCFDCCFCENYVGG